MKSFRVLVLGIAFTVAIIAVFLFREPITHFFRNARILVSGAADPEFSYENWESLKMQNNVLAQNLAGGKEPTRVLSPGGYDYRVAGVYSDYPFNNYASLAIDLGTEDGVKVGMPVLASEGVLLGKIKSADRTRSEVATIFDPNWRSAAAFGVDRVKALLVGGPAPYLDLIPKEAAMVPGDAVFNLAKEFPLNLNLGKVLERDSGDGGIWSRAKVEPPVRFENLEKVMVVLNFP
jgi:cell shape-determining protein MreC